MKVRIISGTLGGRAIDAPSRRSTHVMGDRVRSALFNILGDSLTEAKVLDAFAGSGALGLESLSRGAQSAVFIEKDRRAAQTVVKNTTLLNLTPKSRVINTTIDNWLRTTDEKTEQFDVIFADPPYQDPQFSTVFKLLGCLKPDGLMVLSYPGRTMCVPAVEGVVVVDKREYGEAGIAIFKKASR
jgi:16S rRNA (guanine966-N2)-methyltransferase